MQNRSIKGLYDYKISNTLPTLSRSIQIRETYILVSLYVGVLLVALDRTIVASLLSHIVSEQENLSLAPWIASSYTTLSCIFQPLFGKLSDYLAANAAYLCAIFSLYSEVCSRGCQMGRAYLL